MRPPPLRNFGRLLSLLFLVASAIAAAGEIEVSTVHFRVARPATGNTAPWLEADVALNAAPAAGRMVNRVRVELTLGFEMPATAAAAGAGERRVEYFRATAECIALDAGRADVRFYLPPELVKRDLLHGEPKFWTVALTAADNTVPPARAAASLALADDNARRAFQAAALAAAPANDGLLQPQFLTPFALEYPRATPTFVRREAAAR